MMKPTHLTAGAGRRSRKLEPIRVGFIPLVDCASLVTAAEFGFAEAEGIDLVLVREASWANVRDHLNLGYIDAAHMLAGMPIAASLGIAHVPVPTIAPLALGLNGNAITFSTGLYSRMVDTGDMAAVDDPVAVGAALKRVIDARARAGAEPLSFGMVFPFSCHNYELRYWMAAAGIDPDRDVRLLVIPPPLMVESLRSGLVDGFCVGEPWNSLAVDAGVGRIGVTKRAIWQLGPEKVLGVRSSWADRNRDLLFALIRAIDAAAAWADAAAHRPLVARSLAHADRLDLPAEVIERALTGRLAFANVDNRRQVDDFLVLYRHAATFPWASHALWIYSQMRRWGQAPARPRDLEIVRRVFRPDLYRLALGDRGAELPVSDEKPEGTYTEPGRLDTGRGWSPFGPDRFFDSRIFDPGDFDGYLATLPTADRSGEMPRRNKKA